MMMPRKNLEGEITLLYEVRNLSRYAASLKINNLVDGHGL